MAGIPSYRPGSACDLTEAQRHVAADAFALGGNRAQAPLVEACYGDRRKARRAARAIFAWLRNEHFVEVVRLRDGARYDVYAVELTKAKAEEIGVESTRWYVKFTVQQAPEQKPVFIVSLHPAEHWPVVPRDDVARRKAR